MDRDRVLGPAAVADRIAQGQTIVVFQGLVLRLDAWLDRHPGGRLAILHMVGQDATDEMEVYHLADTLRGVQAYRIGRTPPGPWLADQPPPIRGGVYRRLADTAKTADDADKPTVPSASLASEIDAARAYPPVDAARQQAIVQQYRALHRRVQAAGYYDCPYGAYAGEAARCGALFALFAAALRAGWFLTAAVFLGLFWHQIMFTAHDAGHRAITHHFVADTLIGLVVADVCCGLSIGWWKSSHNVHHLVTNQVEHDPDIQNVPLFATSPRFLQSLRSTYYDAPCAWDAAASALVPWQRYTYYPVMAVARFNLYLLSWQHVLSARASALGRSAAWWIRPAEAAGMLLYWFLFGYCLVWRALPSWPVRAAFVLVAHAVTMPLHVQITLSHWGMSTADLGPRESFAQRQLRTTMDVDCPRWLDFVHGGLQFQAVHHLFPRLPRHNLRPVQALVRAFCRDTGIPYVLLGFVAGNRKVLGHLQDVGDQVRLLVQCQAHMAATGESGLH